MSESETQNQAAKGSARHCLGRQNSVMCELLLVIVVAAGLFVIAGVFLTEAWSIPNIILVLILACCIIPLSFIIGGYRYEVRDRNLVVRVGFLGIPEKKIPLDGITRIYADTYVGGPPYTYCGHFWFWGKIVVIHTDNGKYSLATKDPMNLIAQLEKFVEVRKPSETQTG